MARGWETRWPGRPPQHPRLPLTRLTSLSPSRPASCLSLRRPCRNSASAYGQYVASANHLCKVTHQLESLLFQGPGKEGKDVLGSPSQAVAGSNCMGFQGSEPLAALSTPRQGAPPASSGPGIDELPSLRTAWGSQLRGRAQISFINSVKAPKPHYAAFC